MYHAGSFRVLVTMAVLSGMVSLPGRADRRAPTFTHDNILTVLRDQQARSADFLLEFESEQTERTKSGDLVSRKRSSVMLMAQWPLFRTRKQTFDPNTQELIFDQEVAGDGTREYFFDRQPPLYGTLRSRLPEKCAIRHSWASNYLLSVMRNPRRKGNFGFEGNLIGALEEAPRGIEISEETVDGRTIVVLTRFSSPGVPHSEIRLDPQMNFAMLSKRGIGKHEGNFRSVNSDFVEVLDGLWLPRHVEYFKRTKAAHLRHEIMTVKTLKFNNGYDKTDFAIGFPPNAKVRNLDDRTD